MADATTTVPAFAKSLVLGEINEDPVFPFPIRRDAEEEDRIRRLNADLRSYAAEHIDSRAIDEAAWSNDQVFHDLGELGLMVCTCPRYERAQRGTPSYLTPAATDPGRIRLRSSK